MSLPTPSKIRELQNKLYRKAKNEASQGAIAWHAPLLGGSGARRAESIAATPSAVGNSIVSLR